MVRFNRFASGVVVAIVLASANASAQGKPAITAASVTPTTVHIEGHGFRPKGLKDPVPVVFLGTQELIVAATATDDAIDAELPSPSPAPGSYRLFVYQGRGRDVKGPNATIDITIGTAGPIGSIGLTGPQGPQGPIGLQGATGPAGATGPTGQDGSQGLQGAVGPQGPAGPQGPQGAVGPEGPSGPQGPQGAQGPAGPAGFTGPLVPNLKASITKQISPLDSSNPLVLEVGTLVTYPFSLELRGAGIEKVNANAKDPDAVMKMPDDYCPTPSNRPGGQSCLQLFQFTIPYEACSLNKNVDRYRLLLKYATPGQADVNLEFGFSTENWCEAVVVGSGTAPVITSVTPAKVLHGQAFELVIEGHDLLGPEGNPAVKVSYLNFTATTMSDTRITLQINADNLEHYRGELPISVVNSVGQSNIVKITVQ